MWDDHAALAVVPARGGSKGIPHKNLAQVGGRSLIEHAALIVRTLEWLDYAVISTDDEHMASEAEQHGLEAPFRRPTELSGDTASGATVWRHAWQEAERVCGRRFDLSVLLQPTSPLRTRQEVTGTVAKMLATGAPAAVTVREMPKHFAPEKSITLDEGSRVGFVVKREKVQMTRQAIPAYYYLDGHCYASTRDSVYSSVEALPDGCVAFVSEGPTANIDEPFDLELAEWLLSRRKGET